MTDQTPQKNTEQPAEQAAAQGEHPAEQAAAQGEQPAEAPYITSRPLTVALLYGGIGNEREISISTGKNVQSELIKNGHTVVMIDTGAPQFIEELRQSNADLAFIAVHGIGGEDGTMQGLLELMGIPYVGSGVAASALGMDKMRSKILIEAAGLMTPPAIVITSTDIRAGEKARLAAEQGEKPAPGAAAKDNATKDTAANQNSTHPLKPDDFDGPFIDAIIKDLGLPCVVKPVKDGSSVGISIPHTKAELKEALVLAFEVSNETLVEGFIEGVEVSASIIGNDELEVLPLIEIIPANEFYDYESKYSEGGSRHIIPARLSPELTSACEEAAAATYEVTGCRGVARVDIIVDAAGIPWVLEVNTLPGMTSTSLVPETARAAGISFGELLDRLFAWALEDVPLGAQKTPASPQK
ncbi:MAG: D-alanine--D-alanine ligase [Coriobacteriales bacterium]|nr:D-alanine--D-alanine ligase [Coriobacteriales bacterium]